MKKIVTGLFICATVVAFTSCKKTKDAVDCTIDLTKMQEAQSAFEDGHSQEQCVAYKEALQKVLNGGCASTLPEDTRTQLQSDLNELEDCNPR